MAGENVQNYTEQGGSRTVFGGAVAFGSSNIVASANFTIGAPVGSPARVITVSVRLRDALNADINYRAGVIAYLSNDSSGDTVEASTGDISVTGGTDGALIELSTDNCFQLITENNGAVDVVITNNTGNTMYLVIVLPTGGLSISGAIVSP